MSRTSSPTPGLEVWIDGDCAVCRASRRWCAARDRDRHLRFEDIHTERDRAELPGSREAMLEAVHVRRPDGSVAVGFDACLTVLGELHGWRWLATAAGRPWFRRVGVVLYAAVARWRHRLAGLALLTRPTDR